MFLAHSKVYHQAIYFINEKRNKRANDKTRKEQEKKKPRKVENVSNGAGGKWTLQYAAGSKNVFQITHGTWLSCCHAVVRSGHGTTSS